MRIRAWVALSALLAGAAGGTGYWAGRSKGADAVWEECGEWRKLARLRERGCGLAPPDGIPDFAPACWDEMVSAGWRCSP
jgi:hypothetical protein